MILSIFLFTVLVTVSVLLFIIATAAWGFWVTRVPYVRSNWQDTEKLLAQVPMERNAIFYDLGSGDGRIVFMAERMYGIRGIGFELTFWTIIQAKIKKVLNKSSATFLRKNFFKENWQEAHVIYCFLYPPLMRSIEEKFLAECKPGTVLISRDFSLPTLRPEKIIDFAHPHNAYVYMR